MLYRPFFLFHFLSYNDSVVLYRMFCQFNLAVNTLNYFIFVDFQILMIFICDTYTFVLFCRLYIGEIFVR